MKLGTRLGPLLLLSLLAVPPPVASQQSPPPVGASELNMALRILAEHSIVPGVDRLISRLHGASSYDALVRAVKLLGESNARLWWAPSPSSKESMDFYGSDVGDDADTLRRLNPAR